jgi:hypothetical protein
MSSAELSTDFFRAILLQDLGRTSGLLEDNRLAILP